MDEKDDLGADAGAASSAWSANTLDTTRQNIVVKIVSLLIVIHIANLRYETMVFSETLAY